MSTPEDPKRLADATAQSPLRQLFASASRDLPSDEQLARLAAQLGPILDGASSAPPASSGSSALVKLAIATGTVALLVGAGLTLRGPSHPAPVSPTVAPIVTAPVAPVSELLPVPPASAPASPSPEPSASVTNSKPSAAPNKALSEAALLEQARRALNASPSYALQLANQHRARFPKGVLTQEREVIAIEALRRLHRGPEADQRAAGFSKAFPGSAHQRRVDEIAPK